MWVTFNFRSKNLENRIIYGEYSLKHWINLMLKKDIVIPPYQRRFVWTKEKSEELIRSFEDNLFVPPVTIGNFRKNESSNNQSENLILDGQQRLTSILLAYLKIFPDKSFIQKHGSKKFEVEEINFVDENDDPSDDENEGINKYIYWRFDDLIQEGKSEKQIQDEVRNNKFYNLVDNDLDENFFSDHYLGFCYLVPQTENTRDEQKYYSSVFRNINVQGVSLLTQESRESLYYLDEELVEYFDPKFTKNLTVTNKNQRSKIDFVRFLALLSQYKYLGDAAPVARGYAKNTEELYENYIQFIVAGDEKSKDNFSTIPNDLRDGGYRSYIEKIHETIKLLGLERKYDSIIDLDTYLFGLIYFVLFEGRDVDLQESEELIYNLNEVKNEFKLNSLHTRNPSALKYLRERMLKSITVYKDFLKNE